MIRRIATFLLLAWAGGFAWFALALPRPAGPVRTDAVVVLTGGSGRIPRGLEALRAGWAGRMFVSGVDRDVKRGEFAAEYAVSKALMKCCVSLGYEALDTRSNAREIAGWAAREKIASLRLVTSDWHMRRAVLELSIAAPDKLVVVEDAVATQPSFRIMFLEYHKLLARLAARAWERWT